MTMVNPENPIGILFMAYGGPDRLEDIPGYLADIRAGRTTSKALIEEITRNYQLIGGSSPLLDLTIETTRAVTDLLNPPSGPTYFKPYLGMRHWAPWIEETVGDMIEDGITRSVSMVLAPQYSRMSIAKYQKKIDAGLNFYRGQIDFSHIQSYHDDPGLIDAFAKRVHIGLDRFPEEDRASVHVIFSAHSLPTRILKENDPYPTQCYETAALVAKVAGLTPDQWSGCYQSEGRSPEPWLGPQLEDYLVELANKGIRNVVSIPVGFVSDHVEVLYDIDIEAQAVAEEHDMRLERPPSLNSDPLFVETLAKLIRKQAVGAGWLSV
ncbi:MAG: ferrochelatase [Rhodothermaceae bacterium]|nr:ferrochelatase [Rhodothermaceae bacterium]MXW32956.1 ferrochelatase [Rhodothermaceae bacterium]MYC04843.1 ferrochelatase [Rhodothermaceae bacterium]MYE61759.1 ferrochelatase [Rhodothermaceae bacterium]MYI16069.1 ferrochelatase [Rhodothermaceae bacterium]